MHARRAFAVVSALTLVGVWFLRPTPLVTHADSTLTTTNTAISYTHGPFYVPNVTDQAGPPVCGPATPCDDYTLKVNVPASTNTTKQIKIQFTWDQSTVSATDFDLWVYDAGGNVLASNTSGASPEVAYIPAVSGTYTVRADPWLPGGDTYTGTISLVPLQTASSGLPKDAAPAYNGVAPRYQNYAVPSTLGGASAGEPSIGVNWKTGKAMYIAGLQTFQVAFNDATSPAAATWKDVSALNTSKTSLDPILFTDHTTGRTFVSQLTGQDSLTSYTDNDGGSWTPSQGGGIPSGVDHQTIGAGPYSTSFPVPPNASAVNGFKDAVYYCSQDIATAFCARSDNGGLTFGAGVPIYTITQCAGIHGHVKVAPDGTVYVPARSCGGKQGVAVSTDDGTTWTVHTVPDSTAAIGNDPSVGIGSKGTVYFGYQGDDGRARIAVSHDRGATWSKSLDVGARLGVQNIVFPAVVAGDDNRAAFAFLGSTTGGDFQNQPHFNGVWHLYISTTYDGGKSWATVDATPNDPVQRGSICISGTTCSNTPDDRNLLDFIDATIDARGRVLVSYADGCVNSCVNGTGAYNPNNTKQSQQSQLNSFTAVATIGRQSGGQPLLSAYDAKQPSVPARPGLTATETSRSGPVNLSWQPPDDGGSPITGYLIYRGTAPTAMKLLANVGTHLSYQDRTVRPGTRYYYALVARNRYGSSLPSPAVAPSLINAKPMCSLPGQLVVSDPAGDQTGAPANQDLDILGLYVAEPAHTNNFVFTLQVANLSSPGPNHQWRIFWDADTSGDRWYLGMNTDATGNASFVYGYNIGQNTGIKYSPGVPKTTYPALAGSGYTREGFITIVVPKSGVGSPAAGTTLPNVQARTFAVQGNVATASTALAINATGFSSYKVMGNAYCA